MTGVPFITGKRFVTCDFPPASMRHHRTQSIAGMGQRLRPSPGYLTSTQGDRVLEVGCGTGQLARPFVEHGFDCRGVDPDRIEPATGCLSWEEIAIRSSGQDDYLALPLHAS